MVPDVCFAPHRPHPDRGINGNLLDQPANWIAVTGKQRLSKRSRRGAGTMGRRPRADHREELPSRRQRDQ